jgi:hypothetical protein
MSNTGAMSRPDWTADPLSGHSNCSPEYRRLIGEVEQLIRSQAHALISGRADQVAGLIMAQLAHVHHLAPLSASVQDLDEQHREEGQQA